MTSKTYGWDASTIEASPGDTFVLELEGTPGAGYQWQVEVPAGVVRLLRRDVQPGSAIGGSAKELLTFEALAPGEAVTHLEYKRAWEKEVLRARDIRVRVK
jgi:predicted secreted protein